MEYYSSPDEVIEYTGIQPNQLHLEDDGVETADKKLEKLITKWLIQVKNWIDLDRNTDFSKMETIPPIINNIALRAASNMVAMALVRRDSPIVKSNDFNIQLITDRIFTDDIKNDLAIIPKNKISVLEWDD
ncbi:MAG: hypothetical protein ACOC2W_00800 [bacterium]